MNPMTSLQKLVCAVAVSFLVLFGATLFAATWAISHYGFVSVRVQDRGHSVTLPIPAAFGHWAISAAQCAGGMNVYTDTTLVSPRAIRAFLATVGEELERAPDGVYLEAESRDAWVRITKQGGTLRLEARDWDDESGVEVSVPASLARRSVEAVRVRG